MPTLTYPGKPISASFHIGHKGAGGRYWAGIGIFPPQSIGHADPNRDDLGPDIWIGRWLDLHFAAAEEVIQVLVSGRFPGGFTGGNWDVLKLLQEESPIVRRVAGQPPFIARLANWDDDAYTIQPQQFRWFGDIAQVNFDGDLISALAGPQHQGPPVRVWIGFGVFPVEFDWDLGRYMPLYDPNGDNFGSDVWSGTWVDWGNNATWQWLPAPLTFQKPFPSGYGAGEYALYWVIQSENPAERRNAGLIPVTREFGPASVAWDMAHILTRP